MWSLLGLYYYPAIYTSFFSRLHALRILVCILALGPRSSSLPSFLFRVQGRRSILRVGSAQLVEHASYDLMNRVIWVRALHAGVRDGGRVPKQWPLSQGAARIDHRRVPVLEPSGMDGGLTLLFVMRTVNAPLCFGGGCSGEGLALSSFLLSSFELRPVRACRAWAARWRNSCLDRFTSGGSPTRD